MNTKTLENQLMHIAPAFRARQNLDMKSGDTVRVHVKIKEGKDKQGKDKFRIQMFEGLVLARKHGREAGATFTVRKVSNGFGVERVFPLYSPNIELIEVIRRSNAGRSKLYYIRTRVSRDIRRKIRSLVQFFSTSKDLVIEEDKLPEIEEVIEETPVIEAQEEVSMPVVEEVTPAEEIPEVVETPTVEEIPAEIVEVPVEEVVIETAEASEETPEEKKEE